MMPTGTEELADRLPLKPPRDNTSYRDTDCEQIGDHDAEANADVPAHITPCHCDSHTGVCKCCGFKVTVGPSGVEYGHARAANRKFSPDRRDCRHRPDGVDPQRGRQTTDDATTPAAKQAGD